MPGRCLDGGEMTTMDDNDGTDAKSDVEAGPDGLASWSDALSGHRDGPGSRNSTDTTADAKESINAHRNTVKQPNPPERWPTHDRVELRSRTGTPNMRTDSHGVMDHVNTADGTQRHVRTGPAEPNGWTYLPGPQGLAQAKRMGLRDRKSVV